MGTPQMRCKISKNPQGAPKPALDTKMRKRNSKNAPSEQKINIFRPQVEGPAGTIQTSCGYPQTGGGREGVDSCLLKITQVIWPISTTWNKYIYRG